MLEQLKAFAFSETALKTLQHKAAKWEYFACSVVLLAIVFSIPNNGDTTLKTLKTFIAAGIGFTAVIGICFALAKAMGSTKKLKEYAGITSAMGASGSLLALGVVSIALFVNALMKNDAFTSLASSIIPFYSFALFGWTCEIAAELKNTRGIILGIIATALFVLLNVLLQVFFTA